MSCSKRTNCDKVEFFSKLHESNFFLLNVFKNLLKFGEFDCILSVENQSYPVHRLVLASCSPFFATFLFKFPSLVKLELAASHLKPADVLQLLSFLYYGHAIVSNHRKAKSRLARFSSLLSALAINNLDYRDSVDGRLILQSLQQTPFEVPPNTIAFDFSLVEAKQEPQILLSYDATFDLSEALSRGVRTDVKPPRPQTISLISIDTNGQVYYTGNDDMADNVAARGDATDNYSSYCEELRRHAGVGGYNDKVALQLDDVNRKEHMYCRSSLSSNSSTQSSSSHDGNTQQNGDDATGRNNVSSNVQDAVDPLGDNREILVENYSGITSDNMNGDLRFVGNVVVVETSENSERNGESFVETAQSESYVETTEGQCGGNDGYCQMAGATGDDFASDVEKESYRNDAKFEKSSGTSEKKSIETNKNDEYLKKGDDNLDVSFDANFKPIVIAQNAVETWKVVKAGKSEKNNYYVTVFEKEEYEDPDKWVKENVDQQGFNVNGDIGTGISYQRNVNREIRSGLGNASNDQRIEPMGVNFETKNAKFAEIDSVQGDLDYKLVGSNKIVREDLKFEQHKDIASSKRRIHKTDTSEEFFNCKRLPINSFKSENHVDEMSNYNDAWNNHYQSTATRNENRSSSNERNKTQYRDNIQLLIEASHALRDTKHEVPSRQYFESSHLENGYANTGPCLKTNMETSSFNRSNSENNFSNSDRKFGKKGYTSMYSSRSKRKQVLNERACDSDVDFYDPKDAPPSGENSLKRKPYRRSLRRLDFNTFSQKRLKTESTRSFTTLGKKRTGEFAFADDDATNGVSSLFSPPLGTPTKLSDVQRSDPFKRVMNRSALASSTASDRTKTLASRGIDTFRFSRSVGSSSFADSVRSSSGEKDQDRLISSNSDRVSSENRRKVASANESCSDYGDDGDSEATVSVEEFATSTECFDDGSREARMRHRSSARVAQTTDGGQDLKPVVQQSSTEEVNVQVSNGVASARAHRQLIKEYALRKLGLLSKKCEANGGSIPNGAPPFRRQSSHVTTRRDDLETRQKHCDDLETRQGHCDDVIQVRAAASSADNERSDVVDDSSSEDANKDGTCSFDSVYREMRAIHGGREHGRRKEVDARDEGENSDDSDGYFVDNTDEDVDWDPSCEDAGSEDSDENVTTQKRKYGGGANVNGAKKRTAGNHGNGDVKGDDGNHANGLKSEDSEDEFNPRSDVDGLEGYHGNRMRFVATEFEGTVYYCTPCNRRYHTKTGFSQHKRFECGKPPAFECLMCAKEFNRKSSLKRHLRQIHKTGLALNVNCVVHYEKLSSRAELPADGCGSFRSRGSASSGISGSTTSEEELRPKRRRGRKMKNCRAQTNGPVQQRDYRAQAECRAQANGPVRQMDCRAQTGEPLRQTAMVLG